MLKTLLGNNIVKNITLRNYCKFHSTLKDSNNDLLFLLPKNNKDKNNKDDINKKLSNIKNNKNKEKKDYIDKINQYNDRED